MIANLASRASRRLNRALNRKGVDIVMTWGQVSGGTLDVTTGAMIGSTVTEQTQTIKGFKYEDVAKTMVHHFNNYEAGDVIVDILGSVDLSGKPGLTFTIGGVEYQQKEIDGRVLERVEEIEGQALYKTLYLRVRS